MEKLLEVEHLTKTFTLGSVISRVKITAVDDVSFYIKPAEIFALAGESGCGKSTTARIIMGFEHATSGTIIHSGKKEAKNEKVWFTEGIQAIFQDPFSTFNPLRMVERYFFETIQNYRLAKSRREAIERIDAKLRLVGLTYEDLAGKYPSEFSGGQLQRISIARALLTDPKLIIADEPVSMVDASLRMSIVNLFKRLRDELGVSVLYITHDLATAYYVCDRIAIMFRGKIVEMGTVEQVLMAPKHPYTQLLRASIPEADTAHRWQGEIRLTDTEQDEYLRQGCRFAGRCPLVMDVCRRVTPPEFDVDGALVACHLYAETGQ
ncbi:MULTISPECIES: ABC transporter ATP-binding protein [Caldilinea]|jgi:peptide/nickel transport system ATP-binding protein|uniref:Putative ABC transporter ATP-binding protein n=1 Tax=Caldilinea aerophila (strain DSM 14535 / JCM 11387 / NBRC 104270 / STL-6-O1) TaxID=926550 RepID=I0HZA0_CALAS|nr:MULTISPECIES: ABC transporter ATP-binding protein [Caldilinea]MBO9392068.1 ABC transporter ATP-binding protein [Caldilinea sp.]BAL98337.1 putative ABC transporter ATP-binding protein [Caldilinea aerophila DSM 14535 = NBRC 104270]GIV75073.1 MAG: peptide ABC transporter ATP-binding protein [Caldilinea sp.]